MKKIVSLIGFFLLLGGFACAQNAVPAEKPSSAGSLVQKPEGPTRAAWEAEWDHVLASAKREGKVSLYSTGGGELREALVKAFKGKYGLDVEYTSGKGAEISQKLIIERRAGIYNADVYLGGNTTLLNDLKPTQMLEPPEPKILLPENLDPKAWWGGGLIFLDKRDRQILAFSAYPTGVYIINTNLVKEGEVASYRDMLNSKWKGKIVINDPTVAGVGLGSFTVAAYKLVSIDFFRELAKAEPVVLRDQRQMVEWVAQGKSAICLYPKPEIVNEFLNAGAPIKELFPKEGGYVAAGGGNVGLINRAPHPNAARVFLNWILTREGGTVFSKVMGIQSAREDVPTDHLPAYRVRQPGVKYFNYIDEEFMTEYQTPSVLVAKEIFGPLMR